MKKYIIGVDVGGTNIKFGLLSAHSGAIIARSRLETGTISKNKTKMIAGIVQSVNDLIKSKGLLKKQILGIGIGMPGPINSKAGIVQYLPNVPGWKNVPLAKILKQKLKLPAFVDNDVNNITLGEWKHGAGKGCDDLVCITLGTGVGGGLILDGKLYRGAGFCAGEIGHMLLKEKGALKTFDGYGYFEHYVGNRSLVRRAKKKISKKIQTMRDIYNWPNKKNKNLLKFYKDMGTLIGNSLVNVVNLLNPRLVIIGGGVSNHFKYFSKHMNAVINERAMAAHKKQVKVLRAKLGDDAGLIGAAILVKENLRG